jgi:hypothetical protein
MGGKVLLGLHETNCVVAVESGKIDGRSDSGLEEHGPQTLEIIRQHMTFRLGQGVALCRQMLLVDVCREHVFDPTDTL